MIGDELCLSPEIGVLEKLYIKLFGVPINGLRIRLRRIMPETDGDFAHVLDAGCGLAVFSYQLAKKFPDAHIKAVDLNREQLEINSFIAEKAGYENLTFEVMDVANLEFEKQFDLVLSVDNLEHIEDDQLAVQQLGNALNNGGRLVLHVPGKERRWPLLTFRENFEVPGHFRPGYTLEEIVRKVELAGLDVVKVNYTYGFIENLTNNISYYITGAAAKNKMVYGLIFPWLNLVSWFGRNSSPEKGAGILLVARKKEVNE